MNEPSITKELVELHGLTSDEYNLILSIIKRTPTFTELGIFSAMWNEHCSYKSSKNGFELYLLKVLKLFVVQEKMQELLILVMTKLWFLKWRATIIQVISSHTKERQRASEEFYEMFSRWALDQLQ